MEDKNTMELLKRYRSTLEILVGKVDTAETVLLTSCFTVLDEINGIPIECLRNQSVTEGFNAMAAEISEQDISTINKIGADAVSFFRSADEDGIYADLRRRDPMKAVDIAIQACEHLSHAAKETAIRRFAKHDEDNDEHDEMRDEASSAIVALRKGLYEIKFGLSELRYAIEAELNDRGG